MLREVFLIKNCALGTSLAVQWLRLCASTAGGTGSIPVQGTKILHARAVQQKKKKKRIVHCPQEGHSHHLGTPVRQASELNPESNSLLPSLY